MALLEAPPERLGIIFILTDNQHASTLRYMPNIQRDLAQAGTTFLEAHNHGVLHDSGNFGGYPPYTQGNPPDTRGRPSKA